jgi:ATP-dependent DNA helicase DinG
MPERDPEPDLTARLLGAAVGRIGGAPRPGQQRMASAIDQAIVGSRTALIQAGTGTGKSLGYLAPLVAHLASQPDAQAVVATATLALQSQLATKDIPTMVGAASDQVGPLSWCVLKGTSNYPCLLRVRDVPLDPAQFQYSLDDLASPQPVDATAPIAAQVVALRAWAEERAAEQVIADRDDAPGHAGPAWAQVSVGGRECLGPTCPHVGQCFVQAARQRANQAQLVVTNHALVAFEAQRGWSVLRPDVLVVDEAHELAGRVTTALTEELSPQLVDRTVRIAVPALGEELADPLRATAERFA